MKTSEIILEMPKIQINDICLVVFTVNGLSIGVVCNIKKQAKINNTINFDALITSLQTTM